MKNVNMIYKSKYSILKIVDEKMKSRRHSIIGAPLQRDEMLALILYTGADCNYDLCASQRRGNYRKWRWFDRCLWLGIWQLSRRESGAFSVYTGLNGVHINSSIIENGYFRTYVSTSWRKEQAEAFMKGKDNKGKGMIIEINQDYKLNGGVSCCDVSWISKFPDECEILFARSLSYTADNFSCVLLDASNGVQIVSLRK